VRINKPWRPDAWWPVATAMPRMLRELEKDPDSGLLGYHGMISSHGPVLVQYWRDIDSLYGYASDDGRQHRPAWIEFFRRARKVPGAVGIWHETYRASASESVYGDMPKMGLAAAVGRVPVGRGTDRARQRLAS
jgi:hypothetical protein